MPKPQRRLHNFEVNGKSAKKSLVPALFAAVTAAILVAAVVSICVGKYSITVDDIRAIFAGKEVDDLTRRVFLTLRLPRTIMAIIAGVGLGAAIVAAAKPQQAGAHQ